MILAGHLARAVDDLVPPDRPLMLHASLRSFAAPIAVRRVPQSGSISAAAAQICSIPSRLLVY